ncbi:MAG: YbhB/YbcL family Raf kinase inhibitor-like protein, partial [Candidatus Omnitrophica bacterium]|nr:YbhB/YbcL family Raf kinase inhibitor-like protein [Candidatus Omnitrophota bacterium]MBD3268814.1 YbhB/YbcL family Raf kinase inhibitor-like protein [Candidatus Omnitrophota bacterium]
PADTKTMALIFEDVSAEDSRKVHWVVYDIPPASWIKEDSMPGKQGMNDFGKRRYKGPCPLRGEHRYKFTMFALDTDFDLKDGAGILNEAKKGHVRDKAELTGRYKR